MQRSERIVRHSSDEIDEMVRRGEDQTDWVRLDALTDAEIEASIDVEDEGEFDWSTLQMDVPASKQQLTIRYDGDVIDWFRAQGPGYQTRMNAVLRSYVDAQKRKAS